MLLGGLGSRSGLVRVEEEKGWFVLKKLEVKKVVDNDEVLKIFLLEVSEV